MSPSIRSLRATVAAIGVVALAAIGVASAAPAFAADIDLTPSLTIAGAGNAGIVVDPADGDIYVADAPGNAINVFDVNGNLLRTLSGADTDLSGPTGIALDSASDLYVANQNSATVTEYSAAAGGDSAPVRMIGGGSTGLVAIRGVAIDNSQNLFVTSYSANKISEFSSAQSGNVAPVATITGAATDLDGPYYIAVRSTTLYVTNLLSNSVTEYDSSVSGNQAPVREIAGAATDINNPLAVSVGPTGSIYVANWADNSITEYAAGADGNATPSTRIVGADSTVDGPAGVFVDYAGDVYVVNTSGFYAVEFAPTPTIASVSPNTGPTTGGTTITITGTGFGWTTAVTIGGVSVPVTINSATSLTVTTPAHAAGAVDVVATTIGGTATSASGFRFLPRLASTGVDPTFGIEIALILLGVGVVCLVVLAIVRRRRRVSREP